MTVEQAIEAIEGILHSDYNYDGILVYKLTLEDDIEWLKKAKNLLKSGYRKSL